MEKDKGWGTTGLGICAVKAPYNGMLQSAKVTPIFGVADRYKDGEYQANAFWQDLGGEIFIQVPPYIVPSGKPEETIVLELEIVTE